MGRRLARLAEGAQVLVVTHSPQVAALGSRHFRVAKSVVDGMTTSRVEELPQGERVEELARMLAGEDVETIRFTCVFRAGNTSGPAPR